MSHSDHLKGQLAGIAILLALANCTVARSQSATTCDENNPYIARTFEHIVSELPDGSERTQEIRGSRARDSSGRVYAEMIVNPNAPRPAKQFEPPGKGSAVRTIVTISDCHTGENLTVFPDYKFGRIATNSATRWKRQAGASLFDFLTSGPRPPNTTIEDLGLKQVEGLLAHGYRETIVGTPDEAEWNGRTRFVMESWISDDVAEIVLRTIHDLKIKSTTTETVTGIRRDEPPKALFQIPSDYEVVRATDKELESPKSR